MRVGIATELTRSMDLFQALAVRCLLDWALRIRQEACDWIDAHLVTAGVA